MRHLKRFNESQEELDLQKEELRDFCETYLAYLLDKGFELKIYGGSQLTSEVTPFQILLIKEDQSIFFWQDMINEFLPFLRLLKDNYNIEKIDPSSHVPSIRKADIKFVDNKWHGITYQTKGLLKEQHNALGALRLREVYFKVTVK